MPIKIKELKQHIKRVKKAIKLLNKFYKTGWFATYGNGFPALWEVIEEILDQTRKEAIKEFAERLKDRWSYRDRQKTVTLDDINETLEEFGERE